MTELDGSAVVLVVDDDPGLLGLFSEWLAVDYEVRTAADGEEALERYDESVDVVLLDRRMPGMPGDAVLERIRTRPGDCSVAMVTAVTPDFDVLDIGFDAYIAKPITREGLLGIVDRLLTRATYDREWQEYFALVSKQVALKAEKTDAELAADERYSNLSDRIERLRRSMDDTAMSLDEEDFRAAFHDL